MEHKSFVGIQLFKTKRQNEVNHALPVDFLAMAESVEMWFSKVQIKIRFTSVRMYRKVGITSEKKPQLL